jgi:hypothetical protein
VPAGELTTVALEPSLRLVGVVEGGRVGGPGVRRPAPSGEDLVVEVGPRGLFGWRAGTWPPASPRRYGRSGDQGILVLVLIFRTDS